MKLTAAAKPRAVSFIFFPDRNWWFHNFMPVSYMKPSTSFIFWRQKNQKIIQTVSCSFTWNCATIKIKNKWGFVWNLIFYIKQAIKSRAFTLNFYHRPKKNIFFMKLISSGMFFISSFIRNKLPGQILRGPKNNSEKKNNLPTYGSFIKLKIYYFFGFI